MPAERVPASAGPEDDEVLELDPPPDGHRLGVFDRGAACLGSDAEEEAGLRAGTARRDAETGSRQRSGPRPPSAFAGRQGARMPAGER